MGTITLTTDFGTRDWFVGAMKGVIHRIAPKTMVDDITHEIPPGDIRAGAFALAAAHQYFPKKTVHVAIVDPGVGSPRVALAVQTRDYLFIGPNNGVLSLALANETVKAIHRIENEKYFLRPVSRTFHGRDIFAPVAAHLADGLSIGKLGPAMTNYTRLDWPRAEQQQNRVRGAIVYIDRFGNAITNIPESALDTSSKSALTVHLKGKPVCRLSRFYQQAPAGQPVALIGSSGFLEIALNCDNAARQFRLTVGESIVVRMG